MSNLNLNLTIEVSVNLGKLTSRSIEPVEGGCDVFLFFTWVSSLLSFTHEYRMRLTDCFVKGKEPAHPTARNAAHQVLKETPAERTALMTLQEITQHCRLGTRTFLAPHPNLTTSQETIP